MSQSLPLVSVIIPVYNHENYVTQALKSVWEQSYSNLEIIIIDDGSKDKSCAKIEELIGPWQALKKSGRQLTFIKQSNQGAHKTINKGLSLAEGEYLTILNSDDYYALNRIEVLVDQLKKQKGEWGFTGVHGIDEHGNFLDLGHPWKVWYERNVFSSCINATMGFQLIQDNLSVSSGNLFFSRRIYEKVGEFKDLKLAHDYDYVMRALFYAEPVFIIDKLYYYRLHSTNTLHQVAHLTEKEKSQIYNEYLLKITNHPPENKVAPCHWYWPILFPSFRKEQNLDRGFLSGLIQKDQKKPPIKKELPVEQSQKPKKMTLITHTLCLSGAPKVVLDLATLLKKKGHKINVISLADGPLRKEFEKLGIQVYAIPENLRFWFAAPTKAQKIRKMLSLLSSVFFKTQNTVICNCAVSWPLLFPLAMLAPFKKFYWYIHDSFSPACMIEPGAGLKMLSKLKNKKHLEVWFGSESTQKIWEEGISGKVKYWSGIPSQAIQPPLKKKIKNILSIGTVSPRKAPHILLDAFIECVEKKLIPEDVTLTIVGFTELHNDPFLGELLIKKHQMSNRIHFIKNVEADELQPFYDEADLYIQASVVECLPLALVQAMAIGLPIITTDVNGCSEAIQHHKTGYVCVSRSREALVKAIVEAINNPEKSFQLGLSAQQKFNEKFALETTQEKIFQEL